MASKEEVIGVLGARAGMYETLASLYFDRLTEEQIEAMAAQDYSELLASENELIASGFNDISRYLRKRNTGSRQELAIDFASCFLGTHAYKGLVAQPYESLFLDTSGQLYAAPRKQVYAIYKKEHVALKKGYDYPDDHLSFECEFMSILCHRATSAIEEGDLEEATRLLELQRSFLDDHLNSWFQRLHDLSMKFIKTRFYRGVLNITQGFFDEDGESIDDLLFYLEQGFDAEDQGDPDQLVDAAEESAKETAA